MGSQQCSVELESKMAYKVSVIVLAISIVFVLRKYWIARDEKDQCFLNMDKHVKFIKELQMENSENKKFYERAEQSLNEQVEVSKKDKIFAESKLRLCENVNNNKDSDLRKQENSIAEQEQNLENLKNDHETLKDKYESLNSEYEQHLADSKYFEKEKSILVKKVKALESELALANERDENVKVEKSKEKKPKSDEKESVVKRNEVEEAQVKNREDDFEDIESYDVKKSNENDNAIVEKSVLEEPKQEFRFESLDEEVEREDEADEAYEYEYEDEDEDVDNVDNYNKKSVV